MARRRACRQRAYAQMTESRARPLPHVPRISRVVLISRPGAAFCAVTRARATTRIAG